MQIEGKRGYVKFHNAENGYTIATLKTEEGNITIVGAMHDPKEGKSYSFDGDFVVHRKYGEQFAFTTNTEKLPEGVDAIEAFLASGAIKGVGPKTAKLIIDKFGEDSLRIMEEDPDQLSTVRGIGKLSLEKIKNSFAESREFAHVSLELEKLGVKMSDAVKIYNMYRSDSVGIIKDNPYILIEDIRGMGFNQADRIAENIGIEADSPKRIEAAIKCALKAWAVSGSTLMPYAELVSRVAQSIDVSEETVEDGIVGLVFAGDIQTETIDESVYVYIYSFLEAEKRTAYNLVRLSEAPRQPIPATIDNLIDDAEAKLGGITLSDDQKIAVTKALKNNVTVITGGPGTGKTTIINTIVRILERLGIKTALAAPTGRAAKRMEESAGVPAKTIHRMLEYFYSTETDAMMFGKNQENQLDEMAIIVDEASMIDILLMDRLLLAIKSGAKLIITGDADQLPSVGAGNVLRDIIRSDRFPVIRLKQIYRQAEDSLIISNAHRINEGEYPDRGEGRNYRDFFIIAKNSENEIMEEIKSLVGGRLQDHYDFINGPEDIQILTPTKRGLLGAPSLNSVMQDVINPNMAGSPELKVINTSFRQGDKVMQLSNNYMAEWKYASNYELGKGIFNGDMGYVESVNMMDKSMLVISDDRYIDYEGEMFKEVDLAYAITIHKSQGNEFPAIIIPMRKFAPMLMTRNLLYTGITRGKKLVVLVGPEQYISWMVNNNRSDERFTGLEHWICERN
ncbi:MAG: ATP-dependent RecD-like DNA helicase [Clostridiales bacterium]|nr:ATP-dependent RecD-like DNA helicase [Clostridiales bacterium]